MCTSTDSTPQNPQLATEDALREFFQEYALHDVARAETPFAERFSAVEARLKLAQNPQEAWQVYTSLDQLYAFEKQAVADAAFRAGVRLGMAIVRESS